MKNCIGFIGMVVVLLASTVLAQDTVVRQPGVRIGIGASVNASSILTLDIGGSSLVYPVGFMNILIPISFSQFRLEPEFGDFAIMSEIKTPSVTVTERQNIIRLGLAAHYIHNFGDQSQFYVGPRFAVFMINSSNGSTNNPNDQEENWTDVLIGASVGGEFLLSRHFSLGAEVQMNYISHGDPEVKPAPIESREESGSILSNNAALIIRWYFN